MTSPASPTALTPVTDLALELGAARVTLARLARRGTLRAIDAALANVRRLELELAAALEDRA